MGELMGDPVVGVLAVLGVLGLTSWALEKLHLVPRLRIVPGRIPRRH